MVSPGYNIDKMKKAKMPLAIPYCKSERYHYAKCNFVAKLMWSCLSAFFVLSSYATQMAKRYYILFLLLLVGFAFSEKGKALHHLQWSVLPPGSLLRAIIL